MLEINGIADALEGLDFAEEDEETEHDSQHEQFDGGTLPHSTSPLRGFRQLTRAQRSGPPVNPVMGNDVRKGDGSPGSIPPEVWELVVAFLLDGHDLRSAARLNRPSRAIHGATLPRLWKVVIWRVQGKGTDFVESDGWTELVASAGFQYIRFLTFEMDDPSSNFVKIESHPAMSNVRAIIFTTPPASYRPPRNHSTTGFNPESIYHCRRFNVFLLEGYKYASSDVFGLLEALGKGRYHQMTVVPCSTLGSALKKTPDGDDDDRFTASLVTTIHHCALPAPSAMPLGYLDSVSLDLSNVSDEAEWQWNQCSYAVLEILRIKAYSAWTASLHVHGLDIRKCTMCTQTYAAAITAIPSISSSISLRLDVPSLPAAVAIEVLSPLRAFPAAISTRGITRQRVAWLYCSHEAKGWTSPTEWSCRFDQERDGIVECVPKPWPEMDVYYKRYVMDICRYDEEGEIEECVPL